MMGTSSCGCPEAAADLARAGSSSLTEVHDGELVESFAEGDADERLMHTASVTKFVLGTAVAVASRRGLVPELDDSLTEVLHEWRGTDKAAITLRHLMTHTSGLSVHWPPQDETEDSVAYALHRELVVSPGSRWAYDNHGASLVGAVLQRVTGFALDQWVWMNLLASLGASGFAWNRDSAGNPYAMSALQLSSVDLVRVGELWLREGATFAGEQLFDPAWVQRATETKVADARGVGLLCFFVPGPNGPLTIGHDGSGGQNLWLLPHAGLVVSRLRDMSLGTDNDPAPHLGRDLAALAANCVAKTATGPGR